MQAFSDRLGAQQVDHLVARNRMHPGRQGLVTLIGVALVVHGEQTFLDEVFHFIGPAKEALAQKSAQVRAELLQECLVGGGVSIKAAHKQIVQHGFRIAPQIVSSLPAIRHIRSTGYRQFEKNSSRQLCRLL
ncbi:hypothetical protein D9M72_520230 [compost metagenome]